MGNSNAKYLPQDMIHMYEKKYYLTEREIQKIFKKFRDINTPGQYNYNDIQHFTVNSEDFNSKFKLIKENPFKDRIFKVFSEDDEDGIKFEGVLGMMSIFSENAPFEVKVRYAFKIYDFDDDNYLSKKDLYELSSKILDEDLDSKEIIIEKAIESIFKEVGLGQDEMMGFAKFEDLLSKVPDFMNTFIMRI